MSKKLTHIDDSGQARMVDVGNKADSERIAIAYGEVKLKPSTLDSIRDGLMKKGDVLNVSKIAGIMAGKRTSDLIPLCHPLPIHDIDVNLSLDEHLPGVAIKAYVKTVGKTGVEMEALTAVSIAALTIYDMVKAVEKSGVIQNIKLLEKRGGKSGDYKIDEMKK
ncbi:MAG: cyclic pyranopterin monophosphate synthase MoaC [Anaerolineaceae bacterium]|nr:cyclic pyranopterin monophosphate synthase MoaC [Anaerolineaceae bacterium]